MQGKVWRKRLGLPTVAKEGKILVWVGKWYVWPSRAFLLFLQLNWTIVEYLKSHWKKVLSLSEDGLVHQTSVSTIFVWSEYWILMVPLEGTMYISVTGGGGGSWWSWCRLFNTLDSSRFVITTKTLSKQQQKIEINSENWQFQHWDFLLRNTSYSVILGVPLIFRCLSVWLQNWAVRCSIMVKNTS